MVMLILFLRGNVQVEPQRRPPSLRDASALNNRGTGTALARQMAKPRALDNPRGSPYDEGATIERRQQMEAQPFSQSAEKRMDHRSGSLELVFIL
jgi:hypothetical protein